MIPVNQACGHRGCLSLWRPHQPRISLVSSVCLLAVLFLTGCSAASKSAPSATLTHTPSASSPTTVAGPEPVTAALAAPPQNCAPTLPPHKLTLAQLGANANVQLVGGGVFWIYRAYYQSVLHVGQAGSIEWPGTKMVVEVGPDYGQPVTLELQNLDTGTLAWWSATPPQPATQSLVLDPQLDSEDVGPVSWLAAVPHGGSGSGWKEWGIFPLFSVAGCYRLKASWAGGSWQSVMAVGS